MRLPRKRNLGYYIVSYNFGSLSVHFFLEFSNIKISSISLCSRVICNATNIFSNMQMKPEFDLRCIYTMQPIYRIHRYLSTGYRISLICGREQIKSLADMRLWQSCKNPQNRIIYVQISVLFNYCEIVNQFYSLR